MDHYAILGVSPTATNLELNAAFKQKKNSSTLNNKVRNSYNLLKNRGRRNAYNRTRRAPNVAATLPATLPAVLPAEIDYTYVVEKLSSPPVYGSMVGYAQFDTTAINRLQEKINNLLNKNYKLHGDIIVTYGITPSTRMQASGTSVFPVEAEYSNDTMYQVLIKGYGTPDYREYKLLPVRTSSRESGSLHTERELRTQFLTDINKHLKEGWKLYSGPVELNFNHKITNNYAPWGYIYQALVK